MNIYNYYIETLYNSVLLVRSTYKYFFKVDCKWHPFGIWSGCNATCGGGIQTRHRKPSQLAAFGGKDCVENSKETKSCAKNPCPGLF